MKLSETFVIEFSKSQNCFHVHTLEDMVTVNTKNILTNKKTDYLPIGVAETRKEASEFINKVEKTFRKNS